MQFSHMIYIFSTFQGFSSCIPDISFTFYLKINLNIKYIGIKHILNYNTRYRLWTPCLIFIFNAYSIFKFRFLRYIFLYPDN